MTNVSWWVPSCTGLELNGMGCSDKGETPPPLPLKSNTADYGNLLDNQDLTSPSTPPPPPPHQRVGVLIRAESSSLMMHGTCNETSDRYTHLTFGSASSTIPCSCTSCADVCEFVHVCFLFTFGLVVDLSVIFRMCVTEECRHQSVSSKSPHPPVYPVLFILIAPGAQTWLIGWLLYLSHPSEALVLLISGSSLHARRLLL